MTYSRAEASALRRGNVLVTNYPNFPISQNWQRRPFERILWRLVVWDKSEDAEMGVFVSGE